MGFGLKCIVVEWWSNLVQFKPGAPSRQAILIRQTHDTLAQMLTKKDDRIESLYAKTISLERSSKAAEIFSRSIVVELEATRTALTLYCETETQHWTASGRDSAEMSARHAHELSDLQRRLGDAHAKELAELNIQLQEEARLKEEALKRVQWLLEEEAHLEEANRNTSDSVKKFLGELREKDAEIDKIRALLVQKDKEIKLVLQQKETELTLLQQQKETEIKLLASEHLSVLKSKETELLRELEALSKAKLAEAEAASARHAAELRKTEEKYEALLAKKDASLEDLVAKHITEIDEAVAKHRAELRKKEDEYAAMVAKKDAQWEELDTKRLADMEHLMAAKDELEKKCMTDIQSISGGMSKEVSLPCHSPLFSA